MHFLSRVVIVPHITAGCLLVAAVVGCGTRTSLVGQPLATLDLAPITSGAKPIALGDLKGKVTLINFWATWCGPCVEELPQLLRVAGGYRDRNDFQFLSVSTGHPTVEEIRSETVAFLQTHNLDVPVYADIQGRTQQGLPGAAAGAVPVTVLVDREGKIAKLVVGYMPAELDEVQLLIATMLQAHE